MGKQRFNIGRLPSNFNQDKRKHRFCQYLTPARFAAQGDQPVRSLPLRSHFAWSCFAT